MLVIAETKVFFEIVTSAKSKRQRIWRRNRLSSTAVNLKRNLSDGRDPP
jgi:hypothetical protein